MLFTINFRDQTKVEKTIKASYYEEKPAGFITFRSGAGEQLLMLRKDDIEQIETT